MTEEEKKSKFWDYAGLAGLIAVGGFAGGALWGYFHRDQVKMFKGFVIGGVASLLNLPMHFAYNHYSGGINEEIHFASADDSSMVIELDREYTYLPGTKTWKSTIAHFGDLATLVPYNAIFGEIPQESGNRATLTLTDRNVDLDFTTNGDLLNTQKVSFKCNFTYHFKEGSRISPSFAWSQIFVYEAADMSNIERKIFDGDVSLNSLTHVDFGLEDVYCKNQLDRLGWGMMHREEEASGGLKNEWK